MLSFRHGRVRRLAQPNLTPAVAERKRFLGRSQAFVPGESRKDKILQECCSGWTLNAGLGHKQNLQDRGVRCIASAPVHGSLAVLQQKPLQRFGILHRAHPFEHDRAIDIEPYGKFSSSGMSSTMSTRPSPSNVVPAMPGSPERSPSTGFSMISR